MSRVGPWLRVAPPRQRPVEQGFESPVLRREDVSEDGCVVRGDGHRPVLGIEVPGAIATSMLGTGVHRTAHTARQMLPQAKVSLHGSQRLSWMRADLFLDEHQHVTGIESLEEPFEVGGVEPHRDDAVPAGILQERP